MREDRANQKGLRGRDWLVEGRCPRYKGQELVNGHLRGRGEAVIKEIEDSFIRLRDEADETTCNQRERELGEKFSYNVKQQYEIERNFKHPRSSKKLKTLS